MTPEDHEKRIEAARDAIYAEWSRSGDPRATWSDLARVALDAADRAVPVASVPEHERAEAAARDFSEALAFYGDPDTYFAWAFLGDPPCGEWDTDFEDVPNYGSAKPGKRARDVLSAHPNFARDADT